MKRLISVLVALCAVSAQAQTVENDLTGLHMEPELASYLAGILPGGSVLGNNTYLKARNQANGADIDVLKVDATDDTVLNADTGDSVKLSVAGSAMVTLDGTNLKYYPAGDSNRLFTFGGASDTAHTLKFGDSGTTAVQQLLVCASTSDADDDSSLILAGGGADGGTRGASITLPGEEVSGGADITYNAGTGDTHIFSVAGTTEATISDDALTVTGASFKIVPGATSLLLQNNANNATNLGITDAGVVTARAGLVATAGGVTVSGGNVTLSAGILNVGSNFETVAGAGSTVADAGALSATKMFHQVTGANGTLGVKFATAAAGQVHYILNTTAGVLKVYAASGGTINGAAADAAFQALTGIKPILCVATGADTWICS